MRQIHRQPATKLRKRDSAGAHRICGSEDARTSNLCLLAHIKYSRTSLQFSPKLMSKWLQPPLTSVRSWASWHLPSDCPLHCLRCILEITQKAGRQNCGSAIPPGREAYRPRGRAPEQFMSSPPLYKRFSSTFQCGDSSTMSQRATLPSKTGLITSKAGFFDYYKPY